MAGLKLTRSELAERLRLSKGRVSQLITQELPVEPDGRVDALAAGQWVLDNLYMSLPRTLFPAMRLIGGFPARAECGRELL